MSLLQALVVLAAGFTAGGINAVVGSGSLITFPVLLAVGYAPVTANVSNSIGLAFGNVSAVMGYRRELVGQRERVLFGGVGTAFGAITGGVLLLTLPEGVFEAVVPALILLAALRFLIPDKLQRLNGLKNVMVGIANGVAALLFMIVAHVAWDAAALIAVGSIAGAQLGARYGRRIPEETLRWTVVIVGIAVAIVLFAK
jgi:uncharacterized membrane protein YfcA